MPPLSSHQAATAAKVLIVGDSGSGKTGALASLAKAGYRLIILDLDNGLDVVYNLLRNSPAAENVFYETCTDEMQTIGGTVLPKGTPKAWTTAMQLLTRWKVSERPGLPAYDLGPASSWDEKSVLVIDSMTFLGHAALRHVLAVNKRLGQTPWQSDWGEAMRLMEDCLSLLYSSEIKCNVIVNSHITFVTNEVEQVTKGFPTALGSKLPPKVGRYFNTILQTKTKGAGSAARRVIVTRTEGVTELKNSVPGSLKDEYPIDTGLADIFSILNHKKD